MSYLKNTTVTDPVAYVKDNFPGFRFVAIAPVEPLQYFVRLDETGVQQALRSSDVLGKERIIVAIDRTPPPPVEEETPLIEEEPVEELPDVIDLDEEEEDFDEGELDEFDAAAPDAPIDDEPETAPPDETNSTNTTTMNKSKLNAAVNAAFNSLAGAITKALKTTNVSLNLSENNHDLSTLTADGVAAASFRIQRFPGCDPLLLVSKFSIEEPFRNSGLNRTLHQVLDDAAQRAGAAGILATVRQDNQLQNVILEFTGWTPIQSFTNPKTSAGVQLYYKEVNG